MSDRTQALVDERGSDYGHPLDNHTTTAQLWAAYLARRFGVKLALTYRDVCWLNVLQKVSRDANRPKQDSVDDVEGYARNITMAVAEERRRAELNAMALAGDIQPEGLG